MKTALIVIDTESSVCQKFESRIKIAQAPYVAMNVDPITTLGEQELITDVIEKVERLLDEKYSLAVFFVDLVVDDDKKVYSRTGQSTYDNLGLSIAVALRREYPQSPIFVITGKVTVPAEESLLSEASLEDVDGVLTKDFLKGSGSSIERINRIVEKGIVKRALAMGKGGGDNYERELEQKFKIVYSIGQAQRDLENWCAEPQGCEYPVGVVYLDIDNFKKLNSEFTETAIDKSILPDFQRLLQKRCQHRGAAYRHGGEEFVILLKNCSKEETLGFAESLRQQIEQNKFTVEGQEKQITASIGIAVWTQKKTLSDVIDEANRAEHKAKDEGRNRVCSE
jgi:diguanylate cyclase (GGDEF)-like protein